MIHKLKAHFQRHKLRRAQRKEEKQRHLENIRKYPTVYDNALISWTAPEGIVHERGLIWKVVMSILCLSAITWGVFNDAWTFSLAIAAFILAYYLVHLKSQPKDIQIVISDVGIKVGHKKFPYTHIKAFWAIYNPPFIQTLNFKVSGELYTDVNIQLNGVDPGPIREFLITKIPELEGQSEKLSDIFLRLFKI